MQKFEIEYIFKGKTKNLLGCMFAKQIEAESQFFLNKNSTLNGYTLQPILSQPRAIDKFGKPRFDLFAFWLLNPQDIIHFEEGQIVELL